MYHGEKVPGFPQHPHRGFETITATLTGLIDHTDSKGNAGRYGHGDLQWMTAGGGVVHGEMFPLVEDSKENPLRFFQIWLNLPARNKMVAPDFKMHWAHEIKRVNTESGAVVTVWAGTFGEDNQAPPPPSQSWAADKANAVAIYHLAVPRGASVTLPTARSDANRAAYFVEGKGLQISSQKVPPLSFVVLNPAVETKLENTGDGDIEILVLQGQPIGEPVVQHGPFVMNTQNEIQQAFHDYRRTQFGGWPWDEDAMVFPREKQRFAYLAGKEIVPPRIVDQGGNPISDYC